MRHPYEVRLTKPDGSLALLLLISYASDRHAMDCAKLWLGAGRPNACVTHDGQCVADMGWKDIMELQGIAHQRVRIT